MEKELKHSGKVLFTSALLFLFVQAPDTLRFNAEVQTPHPFIQSLENIVAARRAELLNSNPASLAGVDWPLNKHRINLALVGCGQYYETGEHGLDQRGLEEDVCTFSVISLNTESNTRDQVDLNGDTRSREVERYANTKKPMKIYTAYKIGGFPLLRRVVANSTGLSPDFNMVITDKAVQEGVDDVPGGIDVNVHETFYIGPIYFQGVKYPGTYFQKGLEHMTGLRVIHFLKAPIGDNHPLEHSLEHRVREQVIIDSLIPTARDNMFDPRFWFRLRNFWEKQTQERGLEYDFDMGNLIAQNLANIPSLPSFEFPKKGTNVHIVDPASGGEAVKWVHHEAWENPKIEEEVDQGFYNDPAFGIPDGGDPDAQNLIAGWWKPVRDLIKSRLIRS